MNGDDLLQLTKLTLRDPREAARRIIAAGFSKDTLWTGLALVTLVNTVVILVLLAMSPPNMPVPGYFSSPLTLYVLLTGTAVIYTHAVYWAGRAIGGSGTLKNVLALVTWVLALRVIAQIAILVLTLAAPVFALLVSLVVSIWGFWIMLNFVAEALDFSTIFLAVAAVFLGALALVFGLGLLLTLIGLGAQGVPTNV